MGKVGLKHRELREEVVRVSRRMSDSGLVRTTSGNVSARTPDGSVLITPSGLPYEDLEPADLALVDPDGNLLEGPLEPSTEVPMHTGIYRRRPRVGGIVHTHAPYSTALACLGLEIPAVRYMLAALSEAGRVPLATYGTVTVAETATKAYSLTEILEEMAELYYRTRLAGDPTILAPDRIAETRAKISGYGQSKLASSGAG